MTARTQYSRPVGQHSTTALVYIVAQAWQGSMVRAWWGVARRHTCCLSWCMSLYCSSNSSPWASMMRLVSMFTLGGQWSVIQYIVRTDSLSYSTLYWWSVIRYIVQVVCHTVHYRQSVIQYTVQVVCHKVHYRQCHKVHCTGTGWNAILAIPKFSYVQESRKMTVQKFPHLKNGRVQNLPPLNSPRFWTLPIFLGWPVQDSTNILGGQVLDSGFDR